MNGDLDYHDYYSRYYWKKSESDPYLIESNTRGNLKLNFGLYQGYSWMFSIFWAFVTPLISNIAWIFLYILPVIFGINFLIMVYYELNGHIAFHTSILVEFILQTVFMLISFFFQFLLLALVGL